MAILEELAQAPWAQRVTLHVSDEGGRADVVAILASHTSGSHVYTCGAERYMSAVMEAAELAGYPEEHRHEVEHRDFLLSRARREQSIILCQSRAAQPDGIVEIDL